MPLSDTFFDKQGLRQFGRGTPALCELLRRRLFPDVCSYCVSRKAPHKCSLERAALACRDWPIAFFLFFNFWVYRH